MNQKAFLQYRIDPETFQIKTDKEPHIDLQETLQVSVILPSCPDLLGAGYPDEVKFRIQQNGELETEIISDKGKIIIESEQPNQWQEFLSPNLFLHVVGLITTALVESKEDFLWIEPSQGEDVWVLGLACNNNGHWKGKLAKRERYILPEDLKNFFDVDKNWGNRKELATRLFQVFKEWLSDGFPFCSDLSASEHRQLTVKVHPEETWFLLFPLSHFCKFQQHGRFTWYEDTEWIVTSKSFAQNAYERLQIQSELSDVEKFLKHSVVILNNYWWKNPEVWKKANKGIDLLREILSCFQNIELDTGKVSLHWYLNPPKDIIIQYLNNPNIWYFFADFHAGGYLFSVDIKFKSNLNDDDISEDLRQVFKDEGYLLSQGATVGVKEENRMWIIADKKDGREYTVINKEGSLNVYAEMGVWQLSKVERASWDPNLFNNNSSIIDPLDDLKGINLSHIRLMRIFHCYSVFDPDYGEPADTHSIVRFLLNAGAKRVEGGMGIEDYFDYLCSLLVLFCAPQGLKLILMGKCFERCIDFNKIMERADNFLKSCNWKITQI